MTVAYASLGLMVAAGVLLGIALWGIQTYRFRVPTVDLLMFASALSLGAGALLAVTAMLAGTNCP